MKKFDSHFHIIDPNFPLFENNGYLPPDFTVGNYREKVKELEIVGGAVVSGSFQKFDQEYLIHALNSLGENYKGVANIPFYIEKKELEILNQANIVAVRFNLKRGGSGGKEHLVQLSNRLYDQYGWHTELYVDSKELKELEPILSQIPHFSIDHLGLSKEGLPDLYYWVEKGVKIKTTGFGRIDFDPIPVMKKIYKINPTALMFGTDLPYTRTTKPLSVNDIDLISAHFNEKQQRNIFYKNAHEWYQKMI